MKIYIIRHGETVANAEGRMQGWTNGELTELGIKLAEVTGQAMRGIKFDIAYSSPLERARQTAKLVLNNSGNDYTSINLDARLKEINMGNWEGKLFKSELPKNEVMQFLSNPILLGHLPGGEGVEQVCKRTQEFLNELVQNCSYDNVLVSTHGFALRALLNCLYENKADFWHGHVPYNCAVNIVEVCDGKCRLIADDKVYYDKADCIDRYAQ